MKRFGPRTTLFVALVMSIMTAMTLSNWSRRRATPVAAEVSSLPEPRKPIHVRPLSGETVSEGEYRFWADRTPFQMLSTLRFGGSGGYGVGSKCENFVQDEDLAGLIQLLDSIEPAAHAVLLISSCAPQGPSAVGHEAAYLLEGYRVGVYPPSLGSYNFKPNYAELKARYGKSVR
jgi:hypothetical protein